MFFHYRSPLRSRWFAVHVEQLVGCNLQVFQWERWEYLPRISSQDQMSHTDSPWPERPNGSTISRRLSSQEYCRVHAAPDARRSTQLTSAICWRIQWNCQQVLKGVKHILLFSTPSRAVHSTGGSVALTEFFSRATKQQGYLQGKRAKTTVTNATNPMQMPNVKLPVKLAKYNWPIGEICKMILLFWLVNNCIWHVWQLS